MTDTTTAAPVRATWKGHGRPTAGLYFPGAAADAPSVTVGTRVRISLQGGNVQLRDYYSDAPIAGLGVAARFWFVDEHTNVRPAEKVDELEKVWQAAEQTLVGLIENGSTFEKEAAMFAEQKAHEALLLAKADAGLCVYTRCRTEALAGKSWCESHRLV